MSINYWTSFFSDQKRVESKSMPVIGGAKAASE